MPDVDFRARLKRLNVSKRGLARVIAALADRPIQIRTVERWGTDRNPPDTVLALLVLMEKHPEGWRHLLQDTTEARSKAPGDEVR